MIFSFIPELMLVSRPRTSHLHSERRQEEGQEGRRKRSGGGGEEKTGRETRRKGEQEAQRAAEAPSAMGLGAPGSHPSGVVVVQVRRVFSQNELPHFPVFPPVPLYPGST